jgi:plastocyanin
MIRRAAFAAALLLLLSSASVSAATRTVEIDNFAYDPTPLKVTIGDSVRWHNGDSADHTATANLFNSFDKFVASGATSTSVPFARAGSFGYHCTIHAGMNGRVKVRMTISPSTGTTATTFVIAVATVSLPSGFVEDIQRRKATGTFTTWKSITTKTTTWSPASTGTWQFRARLRKTSNNQATGWSPVKSVEVN